VLKALFAAFVLLLSHVRIAQASDDPVNAYADSLAKLLVDNDQDALYQQFAPSLRASYSCEDLSSLAASWST
jgi:hypothetical protein